MWKKGKQIINRRVHASSQEIIFLNDMWLYINTRYHWESVIIKSKGLQSLLKTRKKEYALYTTLFIQKSIEYSRFMAMPVCYSGIILKAFISVFVG